MYTILLIHPLIDGSPFGFQIMLLWTSVYKYLSCYFEYIWGHITIRISSLSHSIVFLYFFALVNEEGFLVSPCYSLELCIQMGLSFLFSFAFHIFYFLYITYLVLMAPHSSTLAWKIPWTEEPGGLQSMGSRRVGHDWVTSLSFFTFMHWRRKWQPTPVFLPGESWGQGSLVGCRV